MASSERLEQLRLLLEWLRRWADSGSSVLPSDARVFLRGTGASPAEVAGLSDRAVLVRAALVRDAILARADALGERIISDSPNSLSPRSQAILDAMTPGFKGPS